MFAFVFLQQTLDAGRIGIAGQGLGIAQVRLTERLLFVLFFFVAHVMLH